MPQKVKDYLRNRIEKGGLLGEAGSLGEIKGEIKVGIEFFNCSDEFLNKIKNAGHIEELSWEYDLKEAIYKFKKRLIDECEWHAYQIDIIYPWSKAPTKIIETVKKGDFASSPVTAVTKKEISAKKC